MKQDSENRRLISRLMLRLLPAQIFLAAIGAINSIASSLLASNMLGVEAMTAIGLYMPLGMLINAISTLLVGGATILNGKYLGQRANDRIRNAFSLDMIASLLMSAAIIIGYLLMALFDLTRFITDDGAVRLLFNQYLLGQAVGVIPMVIGSQLASYLSLENRTGLTTLATLACIVATLFANLLFVRALNMGVFGLALGSSAGMWVFLAIQAGYYFCGRSTLPVSLSLRRLDWRELGTILKVGAPGAMILGYQFVRGIALNNLILRHAGVEGLSAFAANDALLRFFWAVPFGMVSVSRMVFSVAYGEEDRRTIEDIMRTLLTRFVPLMIVISALIVLLARPLTFLHYQETASPVFQATVWGYRILPLAMPISVFTLNYTCYGQTVGKLRLVHVLSLLTGFVNIVLFSALLMPAHGMRGVYAAHVLNSVALVAVIGLYVTLFNRRLPKSISDLMAFPDGFGAPEGDWMNLRIAGMEEVVHVSEAIQSACLAHGVDARRSYFAALAMEEMAGNIVRHGLTRDRRRHEIDLRVTWKGDSLVLCIKDDCVRFDPVERLNMLSPKDPATNIGLRLAHRIALDMSYQSLLGLNVLLIRI